MNHRVSTPLLVGLTGLVLLASSVTACSSSDETPPAAAAATTTTLRAAATTSTLPARASMHGERYCEVLIVRPVDGRITADVYNTWPLNDCPADQWTKLDAKQIATQYDAPAALLNGPRYWLMDRIEKDAAPQSLPRATFGALEMYRQASVDIGPLADAMTPYRPHAVDRRAAFTFDAGTTVHELHDDQGRTWIMQTWSQMVDTGLTEGDLDGLAGRLKLPAGWSYTTRRLDAPLRLDTTGTAAQVLMDDLRNSYSLVATG